MTITEIRQCDYPAQIGALTEILHACVHAGASVNFVAPFPVGEAHAFWADKVAAAMAGGKRRLWVAGDGTRTVGCVMLDWDLPPNQAHRGEVTKLLVHPDARRNGSARALMQTLIAAARGDGKTLLTLDTVSDSPAQRLYADLGFQIAGSIPGFARDPLHDKLDATTYMFLAL